MVAQEHTPGPWTAHHGWKDKFIEFDAEKHPHWCEVSGPEGGPYLSIAGHFGIANARLIAAAPEGLAFAKALDASWTEVFPDGPDSPCEVPGGIGQMGDEHRALWKQCRAFIQSATGEAR